MRNRPAIKSIFVFTTGAAAIFAAQPASAGTASGTIGVSLTVSAACVVNGASAVAASFGSGGSIAFAAQPGLFGDVDAQMVTSGGTALSVLCSPGVGPSLTLGAGAHDATGQRHLSNGSSTVAYRLFSDSGRTTEVGIGQAIPLGTATSSPISVPIYARVNSNGVVLPAGNYTDTVQVTLAW